MASMVGEREIKFIGFFGNRGHQGPYSPYSIKGGKGVKDKKKTSQSQDNVNRDIAVKLIPEKIETHKQESINP